MAEALTEDWRVTEGPAIGREPLFELSDFRFDSRFFVTGGMSRDITAVLSTKTPVIVESIGRSMAEMDGLIRIYSHLPDRAYTHLFGRGYGALNLDSNRGVLGLFPPDKYVVHLYLPPEQFADLLPTLVSATKAQLRIEIERSLDQGLLDDQVHFWNDAHSPMILFNEFQITVSSNS